MRIEFLVGAALAVCLIASSAMADTVVINRSAKYPRQRVVTAAAVSALPAVRIIQAPSTPAVEVEAGSRKHLQPRGLFGQRLTIEERPTLSVNGETFEKRPYGLIRPWYKVK